jgi:anti-sigma B factor antagonist
MGQTASFSSDSIGDHTEVLTLDGSCDVAAALDSEQRIASALDAGTKELVFDLRGVTSVDGAMLQVLFRALVQSKQHDAQLVLVRPNAHVWASFEQNGLDGAFETVSDLAGRWPSRASRPEAVV